MVSAEAWPTEAAATRAVDVAAKRAFDIAREKVISQRQGWFDTEYFVSVWDDLNAAEKLSWRDSVLLPAWAALSALPDPRHGAWEEGLAASLIDVNAKSNPYPSGI